MSEDEILVIVLSGVIALAAWVHYYVTSLTVARWRRDRRSRLSLLWAPPVCGVLLYGLLETYAASDVRDDPTYLLFYMVVGAAWVGLAKAGLPILGLSVRDDVLERSNRAAATAISGAFVGVTLCYGGANIGDGPGWWVVAFSAGLTTAGLGLCWALACSLSPLLEAVTVERDPAAGLRAAGLFVGLGLILGGAAAGDWVSAGDTLADFAARGWPALGLVGLATLPERWITPVTDRDLGATLSVGAIPGWVYCGLGWGVVVLLGPW